MRAQECHGLKDVNRDNPEDQELKMFGSKKTGGGEAQRLTRATRAVCSLNETVHSGNWVKKTVG